ncbi:MAG: hypothetical protein HY996_12370 [Micrococcales bacterium]|nr:hypothetical protein [Micrococcales bacterium]
MARVLLIEDDTTDRAPLVRALEDGGHQVVVTKEREQSSQHLLGGGIDIVVLCTPLPDASVGPFIAGMKRTNGNTFLPVVLAGSFPDAATKNLGQRYGADEVLSSPNDTSEVMPRVESLLLRRTEWAELVHEREVASERERLREELTTLIVHDLKNPLAAILANLDFALEELAQADTSLLEALVDSKTAARRMLRLLSNMLDITRIENNRLKLRRQSVELRSLLGSVAKMRSGQAVSRSIQLDVVVAKDLTVLADEDILTRIVENILDNALRYTPRGGRIRFDGQPHEDRVRLRIGNNGPPIPPAQRDSLFEKYAQGAQAKNLNLGLGMYFCRLAAEAHGGGIWIEEEPDFPTVYVLELDRPA